MNGVPELDHTVRRMLGDLILHMFSKEALVEYLQTNENTLTMDVSRLLARLQDYRDAWIVNPRATREVRSTLAQLSSYCVLVQGKVEEYLVLDSHHECLNELKSDLEESVLLLQQITTQ
ncbi:unnamed protein product [Rodentolepis nana]|uniref:Uncharacterized protein n=1 Tax=Rodentolepis nana TaxID=102285 RepID=A0A0R3TIK4_RODNA|nr:unnamed protein product [Rodentolepis nana]